MKKLIKIFAKAINILLMGVMLVVVLANVYSLVAPRITGRPVNPFLGFSHAVVVSGSMSGTIEVNDLIVTKAQDSYGKDDIVTFISGSSAVTHRIIGETDEGFITKGDANNTEDSEPVLEEDIVGKVVLVVPKLGAAIQFFQSPMGMLILIVLLFGIIELPVLFKDKKQK